MENAPAQRSDAQTKMDGYVNLVTLLGKRGADKSASSTFQLKDPLSWETLEGMYEQDAVAARIIDRLPDDATREKITLKGVDTDFDFASVLSELEDLDALNQIGDAWRWARLYQGSLLIMVVNDGLKMDQPLNLATATKLSALHVIEARYVQPDNFDPGLGSAAFGRPENYLITVPFSSSGERRIHRSRVIRFDGVKVPPSRMINNQGWGPSVFDRVNTQVTDLGTIMGYASAIMHNLSMQGVKLEGLRAMLCGSAKSQTDAKNVIEALQWSMDNLHMVAVDTKDEVIEIQRTVTGIKDLIDEFIDALVRATDMPRTVILGEAPGGLNASGESELRAWYDFVASQQPQKLTPPINRLLEVLFATRSKTEKVPTEYTIEYAPLWQPSSKEEAETEKLRAETADTYNAMGALAVPEIRSGLMDRGYLPDDAGEEPPVDENEEAIAALEAQNAQLMAERMGQPPAPGAPEPETDEPPVPGKPPAPAPDDDDDEDGGENGAT